VNSKNVIIGILALTTIGGGIFAWQQYRRANALDVEVARLARAAAERADRGQRRPPGERAQTASADDAGQPPAAAPRPGDAQGPGGRGNWQNRGANMRAVLDSPEAAKLIASQQRGMLDTRYAALFKSLNLTPDQLARFKDLLVEKQNAMRDVMSVAREQGLDFRGSRDELRQLVRQSNSDIDASIIAAIGQDNFVQYQTYDSTQPQRAVTTQLEQRLSYTGDPLTASQSSQLVSLLAANSGVAANDSGPRVFTATFAGPPGGAPLMMTGGGGGGDGGDGGVFGGVQITDQVITSAQSFLSTSQVDALRQMQTEQQDQRQLQQLLLMGGGGGNPGGGGDNPANNGGGGGQMRRGRGPRN
jgi:Spy/CpxP family protein refolding chaperone